MSGLPKKIALCGSIASGKTSVARWLEKKYGYDFYSFGSGIRKCFDDVFKPIMKRDLDKTKDRKLLQYIGAYARYYNDGPDALKSFGDFEKDYQQENGLIVTIGLKDGMFSAMDEWVYDNGMKLRYPKDFMSIPNTTDYWIRYTLKDQDQSAYVVVDDLRWAHEYKALKGDGYVLIRLNCSDETSKSRCLLRDGGYDETSSKSKGELEYKTFDVDFEIDAEQDFKNVTKQLTNYLLSV